MSKGMSSQAATEGGGVWLATSHDAPAWSFDLQFREDITTLVNQILTRSYIEQRALTQQKASRWGLSVETLIAAEISHRVMTKVDDEYY